VLVKDYKDYTTKTDKNIAALQVKLKEIEDKLKSQNDYLRKLDEVKADKRELEALKKFLQSMNTGSNMDFSGLDALDDLMKRIEELEKALKLCLKREDKVELMKEIADTNTNLEKTSSTLKEVDQRTAGCEADITWLKEQVAILFKVKLDKADFDANKFKDLEKKIKEIIERLNNLKDYRVDIDKIWEVLKDLLNRFND